MKTNLLLLFPILLTISGCISSSLNANTAQKYYNQGVEAESSGNLELAKQNYYRAYQNTQLGSLGPEKEAYALYEWARVTGHMGNYDQAEKAFADVLLLIDETNGKASELEPPTLCELSRLLHDTGQHNKAIPIYETTLEVLSGIDIEKTDPIGFAIILDDYSESLKSTGNTQRANEISVQARSIRESNKNTQAQFTGKRYTNP